MIGNQIYISKSEAEKIKQKLREKRNNVRSENSSSAYANTSKEITERRFSTPEQTMKSFPVDSIQRTGIQPSTSGSTMCYERSPLAVEKCPTNSKIQEIEPLERALPSKNFSGEISIPVSVGTCLRNTVGRESTHKEPESVFDPIENHYLRNFIYYLVKIHSDNNLWKLFIREDANIFDTFSKLRTEVQALYARLIDWKLSWHRVSTLTLEYISTDLDPLVNELLQKQFLVAEPTVMDLEELIDLLNLSELKTICKSYSLRTDGKKNTLAKSLLEFSQNFGRMINEASLLAKILSTLGRVIKLTDNPRQVFLRTMILFALPLTNVTEMDGRIPLLSTMSYVTTGRVTYPQYKVTSSQRIFPNRESLISYQGALELEAVIKAKMAEKRWEEVLVFYSTAYTQFTQVLANQVLREADARHPIFLRSFTVGSVLARILTSSSGYLKAKRTHEMVVNVYETLLNQDIYLQNFRGKWYQELALIYHRQLKNIPKAVELLNEAMIDNSLSPIDRLILSNQAQSLVNRKMKNKTDIDNCKLLKNSLIFLKNPPEITIRARYFSSKINGVPTLNYIYEAEEGVGQILSSIEEITLLHYKRSGYVNGFLAGNAFSSSVFGIFFWELLYSVDVPNVFIYPYQTYPLDLKSKEFYQNRSELIARRISEIERMWSDEDMKNHIERVWHQENGKKCLVSWQYFESIEKFQMLMECINRKIISRICSRFAKEFHVFRSGFPDLIVQNPMTKKTKFVVIKNKFDPLTPNQKSWLAYLENAGADVCVCFAEITGPKSSKRKFEVADNTDALDFDDASFIDGM